jgi:endoglucanase
MSFELLKELTEACGIPGREEGIRKIVRRELKGLVDKVTTDSLGNLIAFRKGTSMKPRRVMYSAHMDEIGFIVRHIDDKGFIRLNPVGGHDPRQTIVQRARVFGKKVLPGVVFWTAKPLHVQTPEDKKKCPTLEDCFVDVGLSGKEVKKVVEPGDPVVLERETIKIGSRITGKAMDNRTAVYSLLQALAKSKTSRDDTYAVFSTQEEVGLRGAQVSGFGIDPEIGIALDTTLACDTPGSSAQDYITSLGEGVGLTVMDGSMIADHELLKEFQALAKKKRIKNQPNILPRGGTDGGAIQRVRSGVRTITISLPTRYIHSTIETIDENDLEAKVNLVVSYMKGT